MADPGFSRLRAPTSKESAPTCDFLFIAGNELCEIQCKCPNGATVTVTLNSIQPIVCNKSIAVAVALCKESLSGEGRKSCIIIINY